MHVLLLCTDVLVLLGHGVVDGCDLLCHLGVWLRDNLLTLLSKRWLLLLITWRLLNWGCGLVVGLGLGNWGCCNTIRIRFSAWINWWNWNTLLTWNWGVWNNSWNCDWKIYRDWSFSLWGILALSKISKNSDLLCSWKRILTPDNVFHDGLTWTHRAEQVNILILRLRSLIKLWKKRAPTNRKTNVWLSRHLGNIFNSKVHSDEIVRNVFWEVWWTCTSADAVFVWTFKHNGDLYSM